jgi:predicted small metal-binding protein
MVEEVTCQDAGRKECAFMSRDESGDERLEMVQQHAERNHDSAVSRDDVEGLMHAV